MKQNSVVICGNYIGTYRTFVLLQVVQSMASEQVWYFRVCFFVCFCLCLGSDAEGSCSWPNTIQTKSMCVDILWSISVLPSLSMYCRGFSFGPEWVVHGWILRRLLSYAQETSVVSVFFTPRRWYPCLQGVIPWFVSLWAFCKQEQTMCVSLWTNPLLGLSKMTSIFAHWKNPEAWAVVRDGCLGQIMLYRAIEGEANLRSTHSFVYF